MYYVVLIRRPDCARFQSGGIGLSCYKHSIKDRLENPTAITCRSYVFSVSASSVNPY
jgi:hypothetical protein